MRAHVPAFTAFLALSACDTGSVKVERLAVVHIGPSPGAIGIGTDTDVRVTFSEVLRAETVNQAAICLAPAASVEDDDDCSGADVVPAQVGYEPESLAIELTPLLVLTTSTEYAIRVTTAVRGENGSLHAPVRSVFRTAP